MITFRGVSNSHLGEYLNSMISAYAHERYFLGSEYDFVVEMQARIIKIFNNVWYIWYEVDIIAMR